MMKIYQKETRGAESVSALTMLMESWILLNFHVVCKLCENIYICVCMKKVPNFSASKWD